MSDYHVREIRDDGRVVNIIFHVFIPIENNSVGITLRLALSEHIKPLLEDGTSGVFQSQFQGIETGELTQLQIGELYECVETVNFLAADTDAQKQTKMDDKYLSLTINMLNRIRTRLKFWGLNKDV